MIKVKLVRLVLATTVVFGAIVCTSQASYAQTAYLTAKIDGKTGAKGQAVFYESKTQNVFGVSINGWKPGTMLLVTVRRGKTSQKIAYFKTNRNGNGGVKVSSREFKLPRLQENDLVQVWYGNNIIAAGRFHPVRIER